MYGPSQAVEILDGFHVTAAVGGGIGFGLYIVMVVAQTGGSSGVRVTGGGIDTQGQALSCG
ncbi:hypothetical protein [Dysgonomonas gadei]|uniref:hypothetical protein n=1 Tax=Dysgonomonas gadei TaxID=156974 RepID=UPI003AF11E8B